MLNLKVLGNGAYHIFADGAETNMLSRYGILKPDTEQPDDGCARLEGDTGGWSVPDGPGGEKAEGLYSHHAPGRR